MLKRIINYCRNAVKVWVPVYLGKQVNADESKIMICMSAVFTVLACHPVQAQLTREPARQPDQPVYNVFRATSNVGISTVRNPSAGSLNTTVMHTFGLIDGGIERFYGLDDGANTRIGLEYGILDRWSVSLGRMTFNKIVDVGSKVNILRQTTSGSVPVELAAKATVGINTMPGLGLEFNDRLSYFLSLMVARKFDGFSFQLSPMITHYNRTVADDPKQLFGLGVVTSYKLNERFALSAEYLPVLGDRNTGTRDAMAVAMNIDTGGHIFQLFLTSSQWHNEPFMMANNRDRFWNGEIRFGFNIHRVFGIGR